MILTILVLIAVDGMMIRRHFLIVVTFGGLVGGVVVGIYHGLPVFSIIVLSVMASAIMLGIVSSAIGFYTSAIGFYKWTRR